MSAIQIDRGNELFNYMLSLNWKISSDQLDRLLQYLELLVKWNSAYNLTAVREPQQMLYRHLMDSLSIVPWIKGQTIADVGTGPGLPGIPLAIMFPDTRFTLLDSNGKKTRFLIQCAIELKLENILVENRRVETFDPPKKFDQIVSRAFSTLVNMTGCCEPLLAKNGQFLAMKGPYVKQEIEELSSHIRVSSIHSLQVPKSEGERNLVILDII